MCKCIGYCECSKTISKWVNSYGEPLNTIINSIDSFNNLFVKTLKVLDNYEERIKNLEEKLKGE